MNLETKVKRINELYHKSQKEGLSDAEKAKRGYICVNIDEKAEQKKLREDYIANIRGNLRTQLNGINIQNKDGSITNLGEKFGKK